MKPIIWVFISVYLTLLADVALSAPSQASDATSSQELELGDLDRSKRASRTGQTQSQYLNFGDSQTEGKADAEITRYGSRASVSGSNGMGQAQSQSSGSGCDECYGNENGHTHGAGPDPLRSSSGSSTGLPQSQTSSSVPSAGSTGYDGYGRPTINAPNAGGGGYNSQAFGPSNGRPSSDRIKDVYGHGYPSGVDSQPGGSTGSIPGSGSLTDQHPGLHSSNVRGPSTLGSDSFLNRPITSSGPNGRPSSQPGDTSRPSILATRRPSFNGSGTGKLIDGTSGTGHPSPPGSFTPQTSDGGATNGRSPSRPSSNSNLPSYHGGSTDGPSQGKNQPIRSGPYDSGTGHGNGNGNGYPDSGRPTGFQPIDQSRNRNFPNGKQPSDKFDQTQGIPSQSGGGIAPSSGGSQPSTDVISGFRNVFNLPPGLCLVRCETLKPGQALTPDQIRDAFSSTGLIDGPGQSQPSQSAGSAGPSGQLTTPQGQPSQSYPPQYGQPSTLPSGQYPQGGSSSGYPQTPSIGQGHSPTAPGGQFTQGGVPTVPSQGAQIYPPGVSSHVPSSSFPTPSIYPQAPSQGGSPSGYPQIPSLSQNGLSQSQPSQSAGSAGPSQSYPPQYGQPSTQPSGQYPQGGSSSGYPQTPSIGQGHSPTAPGGQYPGQFTQGGVPTVPSQGAQIYPPGVSSQVPSSSFPTPSIYPQVPSQGGSPSVYPQNGPSQSQPSQSAGSAGPSGQLTTPQGQPSQSYPPQYGQPSTLPSGQYPQGGSPSGYPQTPSIGQGHTPTAPGGQYPGQYPGQFTQGGVPTVPSQGAQIYPPGVSSQVPSSSFPTPSIYPQAPSQGGSPSVYPQIPSLGQNGPGQSQPSQSAGSAGSSGQLTTPQGQPSQSYPPPYGQPSTPPAGQYPQGGSPSGYPQTPSIGQGHLPTAPVGQYPGQFTQGGVPTVSSQGAQIYPPGVSSHVPSSSFPTQSIYPQAPSQGGSPSVYPQIPSLSQTQGQQQSIGAGFPSPSYTPGGQQYPSGLGPATSGQQYPGQSSGTGGQTTPSGQYTQGSSQYPSQGGFVPSGSSQTGYPQVGGSQSQGQGLQIGGAGPYLPQYPGSQGGAPNYGGQAQSGTGTGYPDVGDSTAAQTSQGVPAQYVTGDGSSGVSEGGAVSGGAASGGDDDGYSQAESSIKNGEVVASAQGTKSGGTAQTQVQGTYSGSGSFSASAQTADKDRSAQAQVSGHKDGALSSSQGSGGKSQAQAQVEVNEKTGSTSSSGQTNGLAHSSQSEVTANEKGGLADAQSSGPGQTSSQAQIGFRPESGENNKISNTFNGGGQASAQSGVHSGQSQSQIHGNFKYGISYHGAAQAASGTKEQVTSYREKSKKLFQSIGQFSRSNRDAVTSAPVSDIANINDIGAKPKQTSVSSDPVTDDSAPDDDDYEADEEAEEEYEEDDDTATENSNATKSKSSRMEVQLPPRFEMNSSKKLTNIDSITTTTQSTPIASQVKTTKSIRMPAVRSETVPDGFRGKIEDKRPKHNFTAAKNQLTNEETKVDVKPDSYVTVTKSVSGSLDSAKTAPTDDKKFESTYYTKSSTCGYFTFSCNIVYGSNGRSKICRPKTPANGKC